MPTTTTMKSEPITERTLAKDVLKWIKTKRMVVDTGSYCRPLNRSSRWAGKSFQKVLNYKHAPTCQVCAMGALFLASVDRRNKVLFVPYGYMSDTISAHLYDVISEEELRLIETAFEGERVSGFGGDWDYSRDDDAREYYYKIGNPEKRLVRIMKNIVKHGTFRPELEKW